MLFLPKCAGSQFEIPDKRIVLIKIKHIVDFVHTLANWFCYDRLYITVYKSYMYFNYITRYENQNEGRFVLYWGKRKDFPMEVDKII